MLLGILSPFLVKSILQSHVYTHTLDGIEIENARS